MNSTYINDPLVTHAHAFEILLSLASYHSLALNDLELEMLHALVRTTERKTISAFYKYFPDCACPTTPILLCIIENLKEKPSRGYTCTVKPL